MDQIELRRELRRSKKPAASWTEDERLAVIDGVFEAMSEGRTLSETVEDYNVTEGTIRRWITKDPDLFWEYLAARALMAQSLAEEALRVARRADNMSATSDRLKIDALQWAATKMNPREFGDKQLIQQEGKQTVEIRVIEEGQELPSISASTTKLLGST